MPAITLPSAEHVADFTKRYISNNYCYNYPNSCYNNRWYNWGRWVTLGAVVAAAVLLFFCCSCFSARRRKKRGNTPYYGTGWLAPHGAVQYYGNNNNNNNQPQTSTQQTPYYNNNNAAPAYEPNSNAGYYGNGNANANTGYYGGGGQNTGYGQQSGIELQQPGNTYQPPARGEENAYAPPPGPPPNKR